MGRLLQAGIFKDEGHAAFQATGRPPRIGVADLRYVGSETATPAR